jgi:hypothetical protein
MTVRITKSALLFAGVALLATPALAVEPDVDSPAGPELPAPRTDRPDFQMDDQTGAPLDRWQKALIQASRLRGP